MMKKSICKVTSLIVCICMMLSAFPLVASAAKETIWEVMVDFYAPVEGKNIYRAPFCFTNGCGTDVYYDYDNFIRSVRAYDLTDKKFVGEDDVVIAEHQYKIEILVKPENGYEFTDLNGKPNVDATLRSTNLGTSYLTPEVYWYDSKSIILSYVYIVNEREIIDHAVISVTPPVDGEYPDFLSTIYTDNININYNHDDGEYVINGIQWGVAPSEYSPTALAQPLSKDAKFQGGVTYRLVMDVVAIQDYAGGIERVFEFECSPSSRNYDVVINEFASYTKTWYYTPDDKTDSKNCLRIFRDFYCPYRYRVDDVAVEADPPMLGNHPDFDVVMGNSKEYKLADYNDDGFIGGVKWHNNTTGENLTEDNIFMPDNSYSLVTYLQPINDETIFTTDYWDNTTVTATVNGNEAITSNAVIISPNASHAVEVEYRFDKLSNTLARMAVLDIDKPVAGQTPDYDAIVKNESFYNFNFDSDNGATVINGISWHNNSTDIYMESTDKFEAGNDYTVCIDLIVADDYKIDNTTTFAVNDSQASLALMTAGTKKVRLTYDFGEVEPFKAASNLATGITAPSDGEYPDFTAFLDNDNCRVNSVEWYDVSAMAAVQLSANDKFEGGHTYEVKLNLVPAENYIFATNESGELTYDFDFKFDNFTYEATKIDGDKNEVTATYVFYAVPLKNINVDIDAPVPGVEPSFLVYTSNNVCVVNEVTWYDKTDDVYIEDGSGYVFEENHVYIATADVFTTGIATFDFYANDFSATVNSNPVQAETVCYKAEIGDVLKIYSPLYAIRLAYEFEPCLEKAYVTAEYDNHTHQIAYGYSLPMAEAENLDSFMCYVAFYQGNKLVEATPYKTMFLNDGGLAAIPDGADICKVMLWNKNTLSPQCDAVEIEIPEPELNNEF